jgi:hypothetical protein
VLVNAFAWVLVSMGHALSLGANPGPVIVLCVVFGGLATALSVAMRALQGKPISALFVVATLAMWALAPATVFVAFIYAWFVAGSTGAMAAVTPLLMVVAGRGLAVRGFLAPGTTLLVLPLLLVAGVGLFLPHTPRPTAWLIVTWWHAGLAAAAVMAALWDWSRARAGRRARPSRKGEVARAS